MLKQFRSGLFELLTYLRVCLRCLHRTSAACTRAAGLAVCHLCEAAGVARRCAGCSL